MLDAASRAELVRRTRALLEESARLGIRAPELGGERTWLNVARPLTLADDLRGRLVLLDFWTSCCIHCLHVLEDLRRLERRFAGEPFEVVGVHAAKFPGAAEAASVRRAVLREGIEHPVVVDSRFELWQRYAVRAWPTLVLLSPDRRVLAQVAGEGQGAVLEALVEVALERYRDAFDPRPLPLRPERQAEPAGPLRFPGKIAADEGAGRLYVADSGHHRVVATTLEGRFVAAYGSGQPGLEDGPAATARFRAPQGLALWRGALWVADTGNHAVRRVDLADGAVRTVAGTGALGHQREGALAADRAALNSPWDLAPAGEALLVAMAGTHQVWRLDPDAGVIAALAGSGAEARLDGAFAQACLAQPSGLAAGDGRVWVADSESSSVRALELQAGAVTTLAGGGAEPGDLFAFGVQDGAGQAARFQHPLGVATARVPGSGREAVLVADTLNHRIRHVDPASGETATLAGEGHAGALDGPAQQARFREPAGLCVVGERAFVADSANHLVRVVELADGHVRTLPLGSVPLPAVPLPAVPVGGAGPAGPLPLPPDTRDHGLMRLRLAPGTARIALAPPELPGEHPAPGAPVHFHVRHVEGLVAARDPGGTLAGPNEPLELGVAGDGVVEVQAMRYTCDAGGRCFLRGERWRLQVEEDAGGPSEARLA